MKTYMDSTSTASRSGHERQANTHKENNDSSTHYKTVPIGNNGCLHGGALPSPRSPDAVGCWGDVPKRQTCLADLFHTADEDSMPVNRPSTAHAARLGSRTADRFGTSESLGNTVKSSSNYTKGSTTDSKPSVSEDTAQKSNKNSNGTGRERLLEWLRTSQAKRDENNRQVFTRWIDRIDSMNNQETLSANLTSATALASVTAAVGCSAGTVDFTHNPLFTSAFPGANGTNGTTLPGLLAPPAFLISNPLGMLCTPGLNTMNTISTVRSNTVYQNSLNNPYLPAVIPSKGVPVNTLAPLSPIQPSLITLTSNGTANQTDKSHPDTMMANQNESEASKLENSSQSNTNLNPNGPVRNTYGSDTNNVTGTTSEDTTNVKSSTMKGGLVTPESIGHGSTTPFPLNTVYFPPTVPLNTVDPSVVPGPIHPSHYYVPMPLINDSLASQMYYYYYYQNQIANPPAPNPNPTGTNAMNKPIGMPQPWVYYVPSPGTPGSIPATGHSLYMSDNCMCMSTCPTIVDSVPYEMSNRRSEESKENPLNVTSSAYPPLIPFTTGSLQTLNAETNNSNLLNLSKAESLVKLTTNSCLLSSDSTISEPLNADTGSNNGAMDFDTKQWYAVLHDINNPHGTDCSRGMKTSKNIDSLGHPTTNSQSLIMEKDASLSGDSQAANM
ncbi:hypothetical protein D915_006299 [Fasciola hepatica]|uniref:Uncharacterized protein n=1 Tax=Fasciola hepatica TaxID=6192 RepID=A0A2H1C6G9_FASHE|nr:hypothetical protein D915_006299 [Fasciola hepatica]